MSDSQATSGKQQPPSSSVSGEAGLLPPVEAQKQQNNSRSNPPATTTAPGPSQSGADTADNMALPRPDIRALLVGSNGTPVGNPIHTGPTMDPTPLTIPPPGLQLQSLSHMQLDNILKPHPNDVLCGRGGGTNNHAGNEKFRDLVNSQKVLYLHSSKRDKPFVSRGIVRAVRAQIPPGRFLQRDEKTGRWYDIGDQKAREKTSQALREGAPEIRREITTNLGVSTGNQAPFPPVTIGPTGPNNIGPNHMVNTLLPSHAAAAAINPFDPLEMERHMRNVRLAEAAILDNAGSVPGGDSKLVDQHIRNVILADVAMREQNKTHASSPEAAAAPPTTSLSRAVSGGSGAGLAVQEAAKEQPAAQLLELQGQSASTNTPMSMAQRAAVVTAAAAAPGSMPFANPSMAQLQQQAPPGLLEAAMSPLLNFTKSTPEGVSAAVARHLASGQFSAIAPSAGPVAGPFDPSLGHAAAGRGINPSLLAQYAANAGGLADAVAGLKAATALQGRGAPKIPGGPIAPRTALPAQNGASHPPTHSGSAVAAGALDPKHKPPPLSEDMARRLVLAETVAQRTANGTITQEYISAEATSGLYLDAGLLGIDPDEMAGFLSQGRKESDIVEDYFKMAAKAAASGKKEEYVQEKEKESGDDNGGDGKNGRKRANSDDPLQALLGLKKAKLGGWSPDPSGKHSQTGQRIHDALISIGAA